MEWDGILSNSGVNFSPCTSYLTGLTGKARKRFYKKTGMINLPWLYILHRFYYLLLVSLTWVFFRTSDPGEALNILKNLLFHGEEIPL